MHIRENIAHIVATLPQHVTLVAVSKTKPISNILEAYHAGQRHFGENKIQEMTEKYHALPKDIIWHMIGHVQSNKIKYMAPFVSLIHGIDTLDLLQEVNKQAKKNNRVINCLLQIKIAEETTKFGMTESDAQLLLESEAFSKLQHICIVGLMGMATFTNNDAQIESEFLALQKSFNTLNKHTYKNCKINTLSMGMSADYQIAIACGSTLIRVGSNIFGARNYN